MSEPVIQQPPGGFRRATDFIQQQCAPCPHVSDIAVLKDRDNKTDQTLSEILNVNQEMLKELGRITLVEHQILAHREDIERLYALIKDMVKEAATTKTEFLEKLGTVKDEVKAWDNMVKGGWKVIGVSALIVSAMGGWIISDVKSRAISVENQVQALTMSMTNIDDQVQKMKVVNEMRKK